MTIVLSIILLLFMKLFIFLVATTLSAFSAETKAHPVALKAADFKWLDEMLDIVDYINKNKWVALSLGVTSGALSEIAEFSKYRCVSETSMTLNGMIDLMTVWNQKGDRKLNYMDYISLGLLSTKIVDDLLGAIDSCEKEVAAAKTQNPVLTKGFSFAKISNIVDISMGLSQVYEEVEIAIRDIGKGAYLESGLEIGRGIVTGTFDTLEALNYIFEMIGWDTIPLHVI
jgi:hypothetical protein